MFSELAKDSEISLGALRTMDVSRKFPSDNNSFSRLTHSFTFEVEEGEEESSTTTFSTPWKWRRDTTFPSKLTHSYNSDELEVTTTNSFRNPGEQEQEQDLKDGFESDKSALTFWPLLSAAAVLVLGLVAVFNFFKLISGFASVNRNGIKRKKILELSDGAASALTATAASLLFLSVEMEILSENLSLVFLNLSFALVIGVLSPQPFLELLVCCKDVEEGKSVIAGVVGLQWICSVIVGISFSSIDLSISPSASFASVFSTFYASAQRYGALHLFVSKYCTYTTYCT